MTTLHIILTALGAAMLAGGFSAWYFTRRVHRKVSYMLDAMEDGELNFRFDESVGRDMSSDFATRERFPL